VAPGLRPTSARQTPQNQVFEAPAFGVSINRREAWAGTDRPPGELEDEDVRFLLVHHTVDNNVYGEDQVIERIQAIHRFHTGPEKNWPDVAYNFFVDRFGGIWEARAGSIEGAPRGSATGGNQGYSQLCAFIGDHQSEPPSPEAHEAMVGLLAWLAHRHNVEIGPGTTTGDLESLGSNLFPPGQTLNLSTIAGHREVSATACPGDATFALVKDSFPTEVAGVLAMALGSPTATTPPATGAKTTSPVSEPPSTDDTDPPAGETGATTTAPAEDGAPGGSSTTSAEATPVEPTSGGSTSTEVVSTTGATNSEAAVAVPTEPARGSVTTAPGDEPSPSGGNGGNGGINPVVPAAAVAVALSGAGVMAARRRHNAAPPPMVGGASAPDESTDPPG
jgi:hypothetical protein